jgi:hypothetical protein
MLYEGELPVICYCAGEPGCRVLGLCVLSGLFALDCGRSVACPLCWCGSEDRGVRGMGEGCGGGYPLTFP